MKPTGKLVIIQNGWGNDQEYRKYFDKEQVCSARIITGFQRLNPQHQQGDGVHRPDAAGQSLWPGHRALQPLAEAITRGGLPCECTDNVGKALWAKMIHNCTLNPLGAIVGVHYGALSENEHSLAIMNDTMDELFRRDARSGLLHLLAGCGQLPQGLYAKLLPDTYNHNSSTLQDIRQTPPRRSRR